MVTSEDFVIAWATSSTLDEVVQTTKMTKAAVQGRATMLRKLGVRLPKLSAPRYYDDLRISQLNSLINKYDIRKNKRGN